MSLDLTVVRETPHRLNMGYLSFAEYRRCLARDACGLDLDAMEGVGGDRPWPPHAVVPLRHLLEHSDSEGWLYRHECEAMAPVLRVFRPPLTWPAWMRNDHDSIVLMVEDVVKHGGAIRFT